MFNPKLYHENNNTQKKIAQEALENYGKNIKWKEINNRIIDIGCGDGIVTNMLKKLAPRDFTLIGCDINEDMVNLASNNYQDQQTSFKVLDISGDLPKNMKGKFSHVFSFCALNWVTDQQRAFKNIYDLLEQDSECFLLIVDKLPVYDAYRSLARNTKWSTWIKDVERYISPYHDSQEPEKAITELMTNTGFDNIVVKLEEVFNVFNDVEGLKGFVKAINPFKIPEDKYEELLDDHFEEWKKLQGYQNHSSDFFLKDIMYKFTILTVHAHKPKANKE